MTNKLKTIIMISVATLTFANASEDGCTINNSPSCSELCNVGEHVVYGLQARQESANVNSSINYFHIKTFCQSHSKLKTIHSQYIGTFTDQENEYTVTYDDQDTDKPENGHDRYAFYSRTKYDGLIERVLYASDTKVELINKIKYDIKMNKCQRFGSNYNAGNLNHSDNFWTTFCPKMDLITHLNEIQIDCNDNDTNNTTPRVDSNYTDVTVK